MVSKVAPIGLVVSAAVLFLQAATVWDFGLDDAWISFRYAQNFNRGEGLVFNPGERVEGYTNFLWVLITAVGMRFNFDPVPLSKVLGLGFSLGTLFLTFKAYQMLSGTKPPSWYGVVPAALLSLNICFAAYAVSGMETPLFAFLAVLSAYLHMTTRSTGRAVVAGVVMSLATLTRPEGIILFVLSVMDLLVLRRRRESWKLAIALAASFLTIMVPFFLWRYSYYGEWLPNTFYAKVGGGIAIAQWLRGAKYVARFLAWFFLGGLFFAGPIAVLIIKRTLSRDLCYILAITLAFFAYFTYVRRR